MRVTTMIVFGFLCALAFGCKAKDQAQATTPVEASENASASTDPLPPSCEEQGCGPSVPCPDSNTNCYLWEGKLLCCQLSPLDAGVGKLIETEPPANEAGEND